MISPETNPALSVSIDAEGRVFMPMWDDATKTFVDTEYTRLPAGIVLGEVEHIELEMRFEVRGPSAGQEYVIKVRYCPTPSGRWVPC